MPEMSDQVETRRRSACLASLAGDIRSGTETNGQVIGSRFAVIGAGAAMPAPLGRRLSRVLHDVPSLSPRQAAAVDCLLRWYHDFWVGWADFRSSDAWQACFRDAVAAYASGRRQGSFRPYDKVVQIRQAFFASYLENPDPRHRPDDVTTWRGPIRTLRSLTDDVYHGIRQPVGDLDRHDCGGCLFLLLGDTQHREFERSTCWMCVGRPSGFCGELRIDVVD